MAFFKKKLDENFDDEIDSSEDEVFSRNKKFKDLHPENKRKRREPPKPWGKKERMLVLLIILITAGVSAFLLITSSSFKFRFPEKPEVGSIQIPKLKLEKTIIIENDQISN